MYLTTSVHIKQGNRDKVDLSTLYHLCYHSARMYNVGLFSVRQCFFNTGEYLNYYANYHECKDNENYKLLLTDTGQQILRIVDRDFRSFFKLLKMKKDGKYSAKVNIPKYKEKEGLTTCVIQGRSIRIQKDGTVRFGLTIPFRKLYNIDSKYVSLTIPKNLRGIETFKEVRIIPLYGGREFKMEFIYEAKEHEKVEAVKGNCLSIDVGVSNLMACTVFSNGQSHQFLIDGRRIKSINARYNKIMSRLRSEADKAGIKGMTRRMMRLSAARAGKINDYFNKSVKLLVDKCFRHNVQKLVIGYNKGQKQEINNGHANNQTFVAIPFWKLRSKIQYKCELHGIEYCPQEESYTSRASSIDGDPIPTYGKEKEAPVFSGKRVKRGLYRSKEKLLLNADINGSVNILRKCLKECKLNELSSDSIRALVNRPCLRISPWTQAPSFREG